MDFRRTSPDGRIAWVPIPADRRSRTRLPRRPSRSHGTEPWRLGRRPVRGQHFDRRTSAISIQTSTHGHSSANPGGGLYSDRPEQLKATSITRRLDQETCSSSSGCSETGHRPALRRTPDEQKPGASNTESSDAFRSPNTSESEKTLKQHASSARGSRTTPTPSAAHGERTTRCTSPPTTSKYRGWPRTPPGADCSSYAGESLALDETQRDTAEPMARARFHD